MDLSLLTVPTVVAFLLVLTRVSGLLVASPLLSLREIPAQVKIGMAFTMALILFPIHSARLVVPQNLIQMAVMLAQELITGMLIGFVATLVFTGIQMAGEFIAMQMGLSISSILDPISGAQMPAFGQLYFYLAALLFLSLNVHHALIIGLDKSFAAVPLGTFYGNMGQLAERFTALTGQMLVLAVVVSLPVMGILLVTEVCLGFMAKVMPQMNIFMVGLPLKVGVGIVVFGASLPYVANLLGNEYAAMVQHIYHLY